MVIDNCSGSESHERDKEELQQRKKACFNYKLKGLSHEMDLAFDYMVSFGTK
jgi:hypothetical protein